MSRGWLLFVLVACGGAPAPPSRWKVVLPSVPADVPTTIVERNVWGREVWAAPRPALDLDAMLPNLDEELRWPLASSSHPVLEPRYAIDKALAEPGVTWTDLCRRGVQNRHAGTAAGQERQEYLRAWCSVADHDIDGAVGHLAKLTHPIVVGLGAAVALDLADVLVESCGAAGAEHLLGMHTVSDPDVLDTLAATYLEADRPDDAREINSLALQSNEREPARCHRWTREIALAAPWERPKLVEDFAKLELGTPNHTCRQLVDTVSCFVSPGDLCANYFVDQKIDPRYVALFAAYHGWPRVPADFTTWFNLADTATKALGLAGADQLAVAALEAAFVVAQCDDTKQPDIMRLARLTRAQPHDPSLNVPLEKLLVSDDICRREPPSK